jgi:DNA-binding NtrC family response regulator
LTLHLGVQGLLADITNFNGYRGYIPDTKTGRLYMLSVLYVDDEPSLLTVCKLYLERHSDISVSISSSVEHALTLLETTSFDVIISDYQMPGTDGIGFLKILRENNCFIPFILFTGRGREEVMIEALDNGAAFYLQKGGHSKSLFAELDDKIREASQQRQVENKIKEDRILVQPVL